MRTALVAKAKDFKVSLVGLLLLCQSYGATAYYFLSCRVNVLMQSQPGAVVGNDNVHFIRLEQR